MLAIIAQAAIYWQQRNFMMRQWKVTQKSVERTDTIIEKMQGQLAIMQDTLDHERIRALEDARDRTKQLQIMENQAAISETQMEIAAEAAKITELQLEAMKAQAKTMDQTLVFGTRAYLGIHSVNLDIASRRIFLYIENVGKVPAKNITIVTEILAEVPEAKYSELCTQPQTRHWGQREGERRLQIPFLNRLGRTKVFPGNLRVPVMIRLDNSPYFSDQQFALITGGYAKFRIRGVIMYSDGFHSGKKTEFAFRYFGKNLLWVPEIIEGPEVQTDPEKPDSDYNPTSRA